MYHVGTNTFCPKKEERTISMDSIDSIERIPPHNREAEMAVLGSMLIDNEAIAKVIEILHKDYFYVPAHQLIYNAMLTLFDKTHPVDIVTVSNLLKEDDILEKIGGYSYLINLTNTIPTTSNVEYYARIIEEKAILRQLIKVGSEIINDAYNQEDNIHTLLDSTERKIFEIGQRRFTQQLIPLKVLLIQQFEKLEKIYSKVDVTEEVAHTGLTDLDVFLGSLQPSDLIILAARPSMGKTSLALNIGRNIALDQQLPVIIFSLEMSKEQLALRLLCTESNISSHRLRTGNLHQNAWEQISTAIDRLSMAPIYIDDSSSVSTAEIRAKVRRLTAELKGLGLIVIDYLQLMEGQGETRTLELSKITRSLKGIAREMNVPIIALSQLSRSVESRQSKRPMLSDLRESGSIEQDADIVMFIYRDEYYNPDSKDKNIAEIIISKYRNGPTGTCKVYFDNNTTYFGNLQESEYR